MTSHMDMANAIRFLSADAVQKAKSGHPGMPMGMADVATVLFTKYMNFDPKQPKWADRDRFVLSAGHGSMLMYSYLYLTGYEDMTIEEVSNFRQLGAKTAGHPEYGHATGIETTTGPLGQGITTAVGMAMAEKLQNARYGQDVVNHYTYVIAGDGCLMEGISHEAISTAGHLGLNKLIVFWDDNEITIDGKLDVAASDNQLKRFEASGWHTQAIDGHDPDAIALAIDHAKESNQPSLIACKTKIGKGAPTLEGSHKTHGAPLGDEEIATMREQLGWDAAPFEIPEKTLTKWREAGARGAEMREAWQERFNELDLDAQETFVRTNDGGLPENWLATANDYKKQLCEDAPKKATRQSSQMALNALCAAIPEMVGGSADLTGSNLTKAESQKSVTPDDFTGNYMHYGIREFGMAAFMNGMALHGGFVPYGGTFLVFADYMRAAMRLSALMEQRVVYVLTHDSIGLGEDGPTHQPVETVASLRAMPNTNVFRPADAVETLECWMIALQSEKTPSVMALSRQGLPAVRTEYSEENLCAKGAYVLREADGPRKATLIATGSEIEIAMAARDALQGDGVPTAVVSMPCWELFEQQSDDYKQDTLGNGVRVAIEAGLQMGWDRYIGSNGAFIGMTGFGASAPAGELYKHFGITSEAVIKAVKERV
ncbi:transketolase 1, thiamin-binding [Candidatus Terasakiella magnetica]|uniref:Transketolase n=1 Tax=Candidatus Terasakiella magnetica TaxID=1867952 RepID=A0A1C3REP5_9PROT|nr:transketolase [Candidatus Terasakiella magnetica]SCA55757.1 transketolase 1, thiamin-binding [Candidatus Terasakiella magnetica]